MAIEKYLVESTNRMDSLLAKCDASPESERSLMSEAAAIGCRVLRRLCDDSELEDKLDLFADVRLITTHVQKYSARDRRRERTRVWEFRSIIENSDSFETFLQLEREVMIRGGLHMEVVDLLIAANYSALQAVKDRAKPPSEVIETTRTLRDRACILSSDLATKAVDESRLESFKEKVKHSMLGVGGAALVGLNVSALATSVGITTVGSAVSAALGGGIIQSAAANLFGARGAGA